MNRSPPLVRIGTTFTALYYALRAMAFFRWATKHYGDTFILWTAEGGLVLTRDPECIRHFFAAGSWQMVHRSPGRAPHPLLLPAMCYVLGAVACAPAYRHVVERDLVTSDNLVCPAYLVWNDEPVRDVFLIINGSGIQSNAFVNPAFKGVLKTHHVAYSTYDKPGIRAPFDDPAAVRRDYPTFERYTLGHGVACTIGALRWARERFGPSVRLHVRGHSEGTLVALYAYEALLDQDTDTASAIATFVFSGLALEPLDAILEHQLGFLPDGTRLREAIASCDQRMLRERLGISCAYIEDGKQRPSGRTMFEQLAARQTRVQFHVFQGTTDWNTPQGPVRALEAWNASKGHLDIKFHYYEGGHGGNETARAELAQLLSTIASE